MFSVQKKAQIYVWESYNRKNMKIKTEEKEIQFM